MALIDVIMLRAAELIAFSCGCGRLGTSADSAPLPASLPATDSSCLPLWSADLNSALAGGFRTGAISEVVCKSDGLRFEFLMQVALSVVTTGNDGRVLWFDSDGCGFSAERCAQMTRAHCSEGDVESVLDRINVFSPLATYGASDRDPWEKPAETFLEDFLAHVIGESALESLTTADVRVIIIDTLESLLLLPLASRQGIDDQHRRNATRDVDDELMQIVRRMLAVASKLDVVLVIGSTLISTKRVAWAHAVHTRIVIEPAEVEPNIETDILPSHRLTVAMSPNSPKLSLPYRLDANSRGLVV